MIERFHPYFGEKNRLEIHRIFTELADFIHKHEIKQIIGAGSSAQPYAVALGLAYEKRHGKPMKVFSLGEVGEKLHEVEDPKQYLQKMRPKLAHDKKSLLLEEFIDTGKKILKLSRVFTKLKIPHKTATISMRDPNPDHYAGIDYLGISSESFPWFIARGYNLRKSRKTQDTRETKQILETMRDIRKELNDVAKNVPPFREE